MTNLDPDQPREDHGLGWITLTDGVTMHSAWLTTRVPDLFTAWQQAQTAQQRMQTARMIQDVAANPDDPNDDYRPVRIEWTTRHEAEALRSRRLPQPLRHRRRDLGRYHHADRRAETHSRRNRRRRQDSQRHRPRRRRKTQRPRAGDQRRQRGQLDRSS